jgi:flagellar basal-body rod protein FlgF
MNSGIYGALSGSMAQMNRLDVLANNLANVNTAGFKKDTIRFETLLASPSPEGTEQEPESPTLVQQYFGIDFSAGVVKRTDNTFDLALDGDGFFVVNTPEGKAYTRQGNFRVDATGKLVTVDGYEVLGGGGPILLNGSTVSFDTAGKIFVEGTETGAIDVVDFAKPYELRRVGGGLFVPVNPDAAGQPAQNSKVMQGHLEGSNVNAIEEMARLIETTRSSETCQRMIQTYDTITGKAVNELGKV